MLRPNTSESKESSPVADDASDAPLVTLVFMSPTEPVPSLCDVAFTADLDVFPSKFHSTRDCSSWGAPPSSTPRGAAARARSPPRSPPADDVTNHLLHHHNVTFEMSRYVSRTISNFIRRTFVVSAVVFVQIDFFVFIPAPSFLSGVNTCTTSDVSSCNTQLEAISSDVHFWVGL